MKNQIARGRLPSKFGNKFTSCGQHEHRSKKEAKRCGELQIMEQTGEIRDLTQQPRFPIRIPEEELICTYVADFSYFKRGQQMRTVEDCKGMRTPLYKLKKKLAEALYRITIKET